MIYKFKVVLGYVFTSGLVGTFSFVYLGYIPGVFNLSMVGAFCIPLLSGILELSFGKTMNQEHRTRVVLFRLAMATVTVQVILKGIYEIALTNFRGEIIYVLAWMLLILISLMVKE
jgi:hypothetical protein